MKKSNLILGFYVGVIALCVATVSMSIAWYATSTQVRLEAIEMTVDCDRDLKISTARDGEYVEKLETGDFPEVRLFAPVTSAHSSRWRDNKADMPVFYDETKSSIHETANLTVPALEGYFSQKLYLKSDDDIFVTIDPSQTSINPHPDNEDYAKKLYDEYQDGTDEDLKALTKEEIKDRLDKIVESMRFSILIPNEKDYDYAIIDPHKTEETLYGGLLDNDIDRYYDYYVKESDHLYYERVYGEYTGVPVYDDASGTDSGLKYPNEDPNAFNAKHKAGVKLFNYDDSVANGFEFKTEQSIDLKDFENEVKPFRIPVYRNQPQEIVLSIYIEGWDLESINHTKGATFISDITFKIEREQ